MAKTKKYRVGQFYTDIMLTPFYFSDMEDTILGEPGLISGVIVESLEREDLPNRYHIEIQLITPNKYKGKTITIQGDYK